MEVRALMKYYQVDVEIPYGKQDVVLIARIVNKVHVIMLCEFEILL